MAGSDAQILWRQRYLYPGHRRGAGPMNTIASSWPRPKASESSPWGRRGVRTVALTYLTVMLIIPLAVIFQDGLRAGLGGLWQSILSPIAWHALKLTLWTAAVTAIINTVMGMLTAYVLVRYSFPGKALLNSLVDLPLAIPTLVTGVMLVVLYGPQTALGSWLAREFGWRIIFAPPGIILALLFITFPFVVRAVQPVLQSLDREQEEAAATLGAGPWTIFRRVTLPALWLPLPPGTPLRSQTAAVYVLGEVESENRLGASAMSVVMLMLAFGLILPVDWLQRGRQTSRDE